MRPGVHGPRSPYSAADEVVTARQGPRLVRADRLAEDPGKLEIVEGVQPGDAVIFAGKQAVTDGQTVNATEAK